MSFRRPNPINAKNQKELYQQTKDFSNMIIYKEDAKYKPVIAVKAKESNPRIILQKYFLRFKNN